MTRLTIRSMSAGSRRRGICSLLLLLASCVPRERAGEHSPPGKPATAAPAPPVEAAPSATSPLPAPDPEVGAAPPVSDKAASDKTPSDKTANEKQAADDKPGTDDTKGPSDPVLSEVFTDDFQRAETEPGLGGAWRATSPGWSIQGGRLCGENARNHPVWLARRLPLNAVIDFDALTESPDGDLKAEFWGDGRSSASGQSYTDATSYLTIFGGWKNSFHVLARLDEHAPDRKEIKLVAGGADLKSSTVVPHRIYQFRVERRDGRTLRWRVDDMDILTYPDDEPLTGPGHEHFGFNDWQVRVCFDNLRVTPLKD